MTLTLGLRSGILVAFLAGVIVVLLVIVLTGGSGNAPASPALTSLQASPTTAAPTLAPSPEPTAEAPTATPAPLALRSCAEMLATGYFLSTAEKQFFDANCRSAQSSSSSIPPVPASAPPTPSLAPSSPGTGSTPGFVPASVTGMIEFTGGVWADSSAAVPYCVNPANPPVASNGEPLVSAERFASLVQNAFRRWQDIPNARITFAYQGLCGSDPWNSGDGVNTIGWGWLFGSAIGLADLNQTNGRFLRQSSTGQLYEVDILIDTRYAQSFDNPANYLDWRLQQILTHEAGHFLGLGHSNQQCSIMFPAIQYVADLCWVEIAATQTLYP